MASLINEALDYLYETLHDPEIAGESVVYFRGASSVTVDAVLEKATVAPPSLLSIEPGRLDAVQPNPKNIDHDFFYALISNNSNRLIVIYNDNYINSKSCNIGILEELLTDLRIKEYFKLNYNFLTQIFDIEESNFFVPNYTQENLSDDEFEVLKNIDLKQPKYLKHNVFEIYIRK